MHIQTNGERLWSSIMDLATIGATERGGLCRLEFSDENRRARDRFVGWCKEAGCSVKVDQFGNIFARRLGRDVKAPVVMAGSHLDTQPTGGRFDGIYGVLAGLEAIRTLNDANIQTDSAIEIVVWTNEEGCLFKPMLGSAVFLGMVPLEDALNMREKDGMSVRDGLARMGYLGEMAINSYPVKAYFEAHIEQGPVLERNGKVVGVVTGAQAQRWYRIMVTGQEAHAGPTPMESRRDALTGASRMILEFERIGREAAGRATIGQMFVHPNSPNVIPGRVEFSGDLRHPDEEQLQRMDAEMRSVCNEIAHAAGLAIDIAQTTHIAAVAFNRSLVDVVEAATMHEGCPYQRLYSGAGHDAVNIARYMPTTMIFIPCENGISHNEAENARPEDCRAGCNVLARSLVQVAAHEFMPS